MKVTAPFGIVTGCHKSDRFLVQGTLASIAHYCPSLPICLIADNGVDVDNFKPIYRIEILETQKIADQEIKKICYGSFNSKMSAIWMGPFEFLVWMDSDALAWGDFTPHVRRDVDFHIFRSEKDAILPAETKNAPAWLRHFFFDPVKLSKFDPHFIWQENMYFCSGAFAVKRNAIPFEEFAKVVAWEKANPGTFAWGEMGMLNYLVFSRVQKGLLKIAVSDLQDMWIHNGKQELISDCTGADWRFPKTIARPRVAHFCGRKPHLYDWKSYSKPFTIARLEHYRKVNCNLGAWGRVLLEEFQIVSRKIRSKISRKMFSH
jgi:hypothetical protein